MTPYCTGCPYTLFCLPTGFPSKIGFIKHHRAKTGDSLRDAKRKVEERMCCVRITKEQSHENNRGQNPGR